MTEDDGARSAARVSSAAGAADDTRAPLVNTTMNPATQPSATPRLELADVSKHFGGVNALSRASLLVRPGEVHGLLGENGSGKSTLIKILAGYHAPDTGELAIDSHRQRLPMSAGQLRDLGISFVHQDLGLVESVTVTENILLRDIAAQRGIFISWRKAHRKATALLARYEMNIAGPSPTSRLTPFERAMVAIIRALEGIADARSDGRGLLVLDEAMAFLADHERALLTSTMRDLAAGGTSVLLVSHDLDDALKVCDRITILRDGRVAGTVDASRTSRDQLAELIVGAKAPSHPSPPAARQRQKAAVALTGLSAPGLQPVSLELRAGEIVGLTGLAGEAFARVPYVIYGAEPGGNGTLNLQGRAYDIREMTPVRALKAGIVLVPGDRRRQGAVSTISVGENVVLPRLGEFFRGGRLRFREMAASVQALLRHYQVRPANPRPPMATLSGGNQQKAIIAKWLQLEPRLLLLDEPTIGVDVRSRAQIFEQIRGLAVNGTAVLCASNDYAQLAELCDRVLIFAAGRLEGELSGSALTKEAILAQCLTLGGEARSHEP